MATIGITPGYARWRIWAGDTASLPLRFTEGAAVPVDLTGKTVRLTLQHIVGATKTTTVLNSGTAPEIVVADQANPATRGSVTITLSAARTAAFPRAASAFTFEVAYVSGATVLTSLAGDIEIAGGAQA